MHWFSGSEQIAFMAHALTADLLSKVVVLMRTNFVHVLVNNNILDGDLMQLMLKICLVYIYLNV